MSKKNEFSVAITNLQFKEQREYGFSFILNDIM
jgi:hypothetical protein